MPVYEYWCPRCLKEFEVKKPIADFGKPAFCPGCNAEGERLISNFASKTGSTLQVPSKAPFRAKSS